MAGEEELRARAVLAEMQMRISQGPHAALSVSEAPSPEEVRGAFLQLTKQFHPARFGRMAPDIHRLANEVFLGIKAAHDHLIKGLLGSTSRFAPFQRSGPIPIASNSGGTVRGTGLVPRGGQQPLGRGTDRPGSRPSTPLMSTPSSGLPRAPTPATTPSAGSRAATPPLSSRPATAPTNRAGTPAGTPRPATPQVTQPLPRTFTPASGIPAQRPSSSSIEQGERRSSEPPERKSQPLIETGERRPTPPSGVPAQQRPVSPSPTGRVTTPIQRTPAPELITPPTIRYSGVQPQAPGSTEDSELRHAMTLLTSKDWGAARLAFHALAAKVPHSRQYRALLCYARGRETQTTGRPDDAVMEFQRALQLDPDLEIAKDAIRELQRKSRF